MHGIGRAWLDVSSLLQTSIDAVDDAATTDVCGGTNVRPRDASGTGTVRQHDRTPGRKTMRKLSSHRSKRKGKGKGSVRGAVSNVRKKRATSAGTSKAEKRGRKVTPEQRAAERRHQSGLSAAPAAAPGHTTFQPACAPYAPSVFTRTSYLPGAKPTSPNDVAWSRAGAISAANKRRGLRQDALVHTLKITSAATRIMAEMGTDIVIVTLTRVAPKAFDDDNWQAAAKPIRDGVADAFGMRDDNPCFRWKYGQRRDNGKEYGVEIKLEVIL